MSNLPQKPSINPNQAEFEFKDMQLKVGDKLLLNIRSNLYITCCSNNGNSCMVTLIGYVPNKSLLVTMPKPEQHGELPLIPGDQFLVRLFSGQYAFSFTVFVDSIVKKPLHYIHLSFPTKILGQIIRKSRRIRTQIQATVNELSSPLVITNLSITGAEVRTQVNLGGPGTTLSLSFQIEFEEKNISIQLQSTIRSVRMTPDDDELSSYGIEFIDLQPEQTFALRSFIHQELVRNPVQII